VQYQNTLRDLLAFFSQSRPTTKRTSCPTSRRLSRRGRRICRGSTQLRPLFASSAIYKTAVTSRTPWGPRSSVDHHAREEYRQDASGRSPRAASDSTCGQRLRAQLREAPPARPAAGLKFYVRLAGYGPAEAADYRRGYGAPVGPRRFSYVGESTRRTIPPKRETRAGGAIGATSLASRLSTTSGIHARFRA